MTMRSGSGIAAALLLAACGDEEPSAPDGGGGGAGGGGSAEVTLVGRVISLGDGASVASVEVCVHERRDLPCATSDAVGAFTLGPLQGRSDYLLALKAAGRVTALAHVTGDGGTVDVGPLPSPTADELARWTASGGGATGGGFVAFAAELPDGGRAEGATAALDPAAGVTVYGDDAGHPVEGRTSTGAEGVGMVLAAPTGARLLRIEAGGAGCPVRAPNGWPEEGGLRVQVVSGYLTWAGVGRCGP